MLERTPTSQPTQPPQPPTFGPPLPDDERRNRYGHGYGRSYMAGVGRWLSRARLEEQLGYTSRTMEHPYTYVSNNPVIGFDPTGRMYPDSSWPSGPPVPEDKPVKPSNPGSPFLNYGNYCGPNRSWHHLPPNLQPAPIDDLDECCKTHDDCWKTRGCSADLLTVIPSFEGEFTEACRTCDRALVACAQNSQCDRDKKPHPFQKYPTQIQRCRNFKKRLILLFYRCKPGGGDGIDRYPPGTWFVK